MAFIAASAVVFVSVADVSPATTRAVNARIPMPVAVHLRVIA